jgi:nucleoid DNA-binding protein
MDIQSKQIETLCEKIAHKYGIHKNTVKMIITSQFEMVKQTMKKVDSYNNFFPYIRLPYLGVFKVKTGKKKFFLDKSKKIIEDVYPEPKQGNNRTKNVTHSRVQKNLGK